MEHFAHASDYIRTVTVQNNVHVSILDDPQPRRSAMPGDIIHQINKIFPKALSPTLAVILKQKLGVLYSWTKDF